MMKRALTGLAVAVAAGTVAMPPAQAATTRDLYMVKDVQLVDDGVYIGDFVALRKTGKRVVGAVGAFGSEYLCVKGKVADGRLRAAYYENGAVAGRFSRAWAGSRIKVMDSVSKAEVRTYLGGASPKRFIVDCIQQTA